MDDSSCISTSSSSNSVLSAHTSSHDALHRWCGCCWLGSLLSSPSCVASLSLSLLSPSWLLDDSERVSNDPLNRLAVSAVACCAGRCVGAVFAALFALLEAFVAAAPAAVGFLPVAAAAASALSCFCLVAVLRFFFFSFFFSFFLARRRDSSSSSASSCSIISSPCSASTATSKLRRSVVTAQCASSSSARFSVRSCVQSVWSLSQMTIPRQMSTSSCASAIVRACRSPQSPTTSWSARAMSCARKSMWHGTTMWLVVREYVSSSKRYDV
ncbi:hypothetical protein PybrP1_009327 [[Pythium] brassicae (nom. inval.)]|nr:hypothetical protein PybrP1_009327 [[Pythium] brassicae (nom. inval.)]